MTVMEAQAVWRTVELGMGIETPNGYREFIRGFNNDRDNAQARKIAVSLNAREVLRRPKFYFTNRAGTVGLARVSLKQLGLLGKVPRAEIFARAEVRGLRKCWAEIGPLLRVQYLNQPENERLAIAMEPIKSSQVSGMSKTKAGLFHDLFVVDGDSKKLWLRAVSGYPGVLWDDEFEWIFTAWQI